MDSIKYITILGVTYALEGGDGNISAVKVGDASYTPDENGVISLPAYPTGGEAGYTVLTAVLDGEEVSLVSTGEKFTWNNKLDVIPGLTSIIEGATAGSTALQPEDVQKVKNMLLYNNANKPAGQADITNITSDNIDDYTIQLENGKIPTSMLPEYVDEVTVTNGTSPLAWDTDVTVGTVNGVAITAKLPAKPTYEQSHYTAIPVVGNQSATSNSTSEVVSPYINIIENDAKSGGIQIQGTGSVQVKASNGIITIAGNSVGPAQGTSIGSVSLISGTGAAGTTDTYGIYSNDSTPIELGRFTVYNGTNGVNGTNGTDGRDGVNGTNGRDADVWTIGSDGFWYKNNVKTTYKAIGLDGANGTNGTNGHDGLNGTDGITPHIDSTTGNWFIGTTNTNVHAQGPLGNPGTNGANGADGKSAYQSYLDTTSDSPKKTEVQWVASLKGTDGIDGYTPYIENGFWYINGVNQNVKAEGVDGTIDPSVLNNYISKNELNVTALLQRIEALESYHQVIAIPTFTGINPFNESTSVTIESSTTGATIYYTIDGTTPTKSSSVYSSAITLTDTATVKAIAVKGNSQSEVASEEFVKRPNAPVINGDTPFDGSTQVSIEAENGAQIRYTTDGTYPTSSSTLYDEPFTITDACTVMAIAIKDGVESVVYAVQFKKRPAMPEITGNSTFTDSNTITISAQEGRIIYTTNGVNPVYGQNGANYQGPFNITDTTTVKAIAYNSTTKLSSLVKEVTFTKVEPSVGTDPYTVSKTIPTAEELETVLNTSATKPTEYSTLNTTELGITRPTVVHVIYPQDWNSTPTITDSNNNPIVGGNINSTTPTITVNGRVYSVFDIKLGVDNFKIQFN